MVKNAKYYWGIKNVFKLEGVINSWECCFSFLNRSIPLFPKEKIILKPKEQKLVKVEAPFIDEISGLPVVMILDKLTQSDDDDVKIKIYMKFSDVRYNE